MPAGYTPRPPALAQIKVETSFYLKPIYFSANLTFWLMSGCMILWLLLIKDTSERRNIAVCTGKQFQGVTDSDCYMFQTTKNKTPFLFVLGKVGHTRYMII